MKRLLFLAIALLPVPMLAVDNETRHLTAVDKTRTGEGVFFALPRTVIAADVSVDLKSFKPGRLARYAIAFFPEAYKDDGDPQAASRSFTLKDVAFSSRGEPDPDWIFWTSIKSGFFVDRSLTLQMSEAGAVTSATATADNTLPDFLMGVFSGAIGVAGKAVAAGKGEAKPECAEIDSPEKYLRCVVMQGNPQRLADFDDAIKKNRKALEARSEVLKEIERVDKTTFRIVPNSGLADANQLFLTYQKLDSDRITAVTAPSPAVAIGDRIAQIDALKDLIRKYFTGSSDTANWVGRFEFRPAPGVKSWDLMALDPLNGACLNAALYQGKTALSRDFFAPLEGYACPAKATYTVKVASAASDDTLSEKLRGNVAEYDKKKTGQGLPYRVPAEVRFSVTSDARPTPYFANILVAQRGLMLALPASLGGRQSKAGLTYFDATGALKSLDTTGKTIWNKSVADAASASATGLTDAKIAADKAGDTKADPLTKLTRQRQLLEEQSKIKALCESLGKTDCVLATDQPKQ